MRLNTRVTRYTIAQAAEVLGVSDDTVRRWIDAGRLTAHRDDRGRLSVAGVDLAEVAEHQAGAEHRSTHSSARNQFPGIVTKVTKDTVMAQVEMRCGAFRLVSLMSREAADELGLEPGVRATGSIKSTNVVIEKE